MDDQLIKQNIFVATDLDRVILTIGRLEVPMPYASSFKIAQGLRLASKEAMRYCGEGQEDWREMSRLDYYPNVNSLSKEKRITLPIKFDWSIGFIGESVVFKAGNNEVSLHFTVALKVAEWLRAAGKSAKRWAGDSGKAMSASGILRDVEFNFWLDNIKRHV